MEKFNEWLVSSGIKQNKVAEIIGVSKNTVSLWKKGAVRPSADHMRQISKMTGGKVRPGNWFEGT